MLPRLSSLSRLFALHLALLAPALALAQGLQLHMVDVGQGDALVLVAPGGCTALFDGGPTGSGATIKSYLRSLGISRLDVAFVSHYHADHMGGIDEVDSGTDAVPITTVYDRGGSYSSKAFNEYKNRFGSRRRTATQGQVISLCSQVALEVVAVNGNGTSSSDENALSLVVKVSYGAFDALIGGDLTGEGPDMETSLGAGVGELEVYKVHHHGSRYSSNQTFLEATRPTVSLISVGFNNTYGHPTPECLSRLASVGSAVWQTEDPATGVKRGHISVSSATGSSYTVAQGSSSASYLSKGATPDTQPPTAPGSLVASALSPSEVELSWSAATDNVGVAGYRVYRSASGGSSTLAGTSSTTGFADMGLTADTTYLYEVTAVDAAQNESAPASTSVRTQAAARVILNELLANEPGSNTAGEFIELVNVGSSTADLSGWQLSDAGGVRHTFASGTLLEPGRALVVFASASAIPSGMSNAVAASTSSLSLNNSGDTVSLSTSAGATVDSLTYGSALASEDGVSMNRSPDASSTGTWVLHTTLSLLSSSAGTRPNGSAY